MRARMKEKDVQKETAGEYNSVIILSIFMLYKLNNLLFTVKLLHCLENLTFKLIKYDVLCFLLLVKERKRKTNVQHWKRWRVMQIC